MFQKSVLRKYIHSVNQNDVDAAWARFGETFLNDEKQQNIRNSIEIQYQEGFCRDLFCHVLGYTINPEPGFNLKTEQKNENVTAKVDNRSADAAVILNGSTRVIIELKGCDTLDLSKVEPQAFGYKAHHPGCRYVVISNFERLRFYIDSAEKFLEFDLFHLTKDEFTKLYLCLALTQIEADVPAKIKSDSLTSETEITSKFYKDYSVFKRSLFNNIAANNSDKFDKLLLFRKTQKLLDRLLFIFFCEDRGLIATNTIKHILNRWHTLKDLDAYQPLYNRLKLQFEYIDQGHEDVDKSLSVFAYNGGLFRTDEVLDALTIDDDILLDMQKLSNYDFESDVSVDILGHIFEHSLTEIEEVQNELASASSLNPLTKAEGTLNVERGGRKTSKRKKDGVFYTPAYITKYIVENTIGRLCDEKKKELGIDEESYAERNKKNTKKEIETKKSLAGTLDHYREWLLGLKICDPACGSGAFLNAALQFLQREHHLIDIYKAHIYGHTLIMSDVDNQILENNLYGVDINEESVEIARLSLWLHTARRGRKLTTLNNNIKCGNSLIDDPAVAGDKAFNWQKEFPEIFENGGFDVVIGNPPYVQLQSMGEMSDKYAQCGYESYHKGGDLYCLFTERGYQLLKNNGLESYIMMNKWMLVDYGKPLRTFLAKTSLQTLINFGDVQIFKDATTYVCIFMTKKSEIKNDVMALSVSQKVCHGDFDKNHNFETEIVQALQPFEPNNFGENEWSIQPSLHTQILKKMTERGVPLKSLPIEINYGIKTGFNDAFYIDGATRERLIAEDRKSEELIKPLLRGRDISAWTTNVDDQYMISTLPSLDIKIDDYPAIKNHLFSFGKERLDQTGAKGARKKTSNEWFETQDTIAYYQEFSKPKIVYPNMTSVFPFSYDESGSFSNDKSFILTSKDDSDLLKYLLAIFNSKLCKLWIWYNCPELQGGTREIRKVYFENFPVPDHSSAGRGEIVVLSESQLLLNSQLQKYVAKFLNRVQTTLCAGKVTEKLESFYRLDFKGFMGELKKQKIKLSLRDQDEWEEYFEGYREDCTRLLLEIEENDRKIDELVYDLYGLSEEERKTISNEE